MIKTRQQQDIANLLDLYAWPDPPLLTPLGKGPMEPDPLPPRHRGDCTCIDCGNLGLYTQSVEKLKALNPNRN